MFSVNTQHSDPYTATGLITVWYSPSLVFLVISLLWNIFLFANVLLCKDVMFRLSVQGRTEAEGVRE